MTKTRGKSRNSHVNSRLSINGRELNARDSRTRELLIEQLLKKTTFYSNNSTHKLLEENREISALIDNLLIIEKNVTIPLPQRDNHWDEFRKWCNDNEIDCSKIEIAKIDNNNDDASDEYGLKCLCDLSESQLIITVPRKAMFTCESASHDPIFAEFILQDPLLQHMPNIVLSLHLINEYCKSETSLWYPYLSILPSKYVTSLYLKHEQIVHLQGCQMFEEIIKLNRSIARQYAYFYNQMQCNDIAKGLAFKKQFTYELYRWSVSTVMTRQNIVPSSDGTAMISALIPLWDMCNHRNGKFSTDFSMEKNAALCYAMKDFKAGDEIVIFYGPRSNGEFFTHNGFVYTENNNDYVPIKLGISRNDTLYKERNELCSKLGINISGVYHLHHKSHPMEPQLLAFLRIFHFTKDELQNWLTQDDCSVIMNPKCEVLSSLNNKIMSFLSVRASILLKGYENAQNSETSFEVPSVMIIKQLIDCEKLILKSYV